MEPVEERRRAVEGGSVMLRITLEVKAPGWAAQGVKEHLAMCLEKYGDARVVDVQATDEHPVGGQIEMEEGP